MSTFLRVFQWLTNKLKINSKALKKLLDLFTGSAQSPKISSDAIDNLCQTL